MGVGAGAGGVRHIDMVYGYDEVWAIDYFGDRLPPYWRHLHGNSSSAMLAYALSLITPAGGLWARVAAYDGNITAAAAAAGGDEYAALCALAWRQTTGATKVVWSASRGLPWVFMKEISSDGDVSTVDVLYPSSPLWVWRAPEAMRLMMLPVLAYGNNETRVRYNLAWAPHHLGTWPVCDLPPGKQEQMPMEESGNLLLMLAAVAQAQGGDAASVAYLKPYWPLIDTWAAYLNASLPNPGNQLCTDDFEGPSPQNANLAMKGVAGLAAYARLCTMRGDAAAAAAAMAAARGFAAWWVQHAMVGTGGGAAAATAASTDASPSSPSSSSSPSAVASAAASAAVASAASAAAAGHSKMQFNLTAASWSQKYNLLYHQVLRLGVFAPDVLDADQAFWQGKLNAYGVPLDDRASFTKGDWSSWIAAMASSPAQWQAIVHSIYAFADQTPDRVPLSDWYDTKSGHKVGFQARPVVGGFFAKLLLQQQQQPRTTAGV